jgi:hypothetical protein
LVFWALWGRVLTLLSETLGGEWGDGWRFFVCLFVCFYTFHGLMGCPLQAGTLKWPHQIPGLWAVFWFFLSTGQVAIGTWSKSLPVCECGLLCCCFCQVTAALHYHCNSVWLVRLPARWGLSVLGTILSPRRIAQWATTPPLWEVG